MKRMAMAMVVAVAALAVAGTASAQMGYGRGYYGFGAYGQVNVDNLKNFQKETLSLRDELVAKRAELANEYAKPAPDATRIADLQKQMIDTQAKIQKAAEKNGLPAWGQGYGRGRMGRGMTIGSGPYGYGCPGWGRW